MKSTKEAGGRPPVRSAISVSLFVTLAATLLTVPCIGRAQSSVAFSGVLDSGLLYTNNKGGYSSWTTTSGQLAPSRLIFTGSEDLGGGMHTVFRLISPFSIQTGGGTGRAFNIAYVGIASDQYGALTFGRQWDTTIDTVSGFASNESWAGYIGSHIGDNDNTNQGFKTSNSVKYASPSIAGLQVGGTYGFSNQNVAADGSSGFADNRLMSAGAAYQHGRFAAGLGFLQADRPDAQSAGAVGTSGTGILDDYANTFTVSNASKAGVLRQRIWTAGGSYVLGSVTIGGIYSKVQYHYLDATALTLDNYEINASVFIAPALQTGIAYVRTDGSYSGKGTGNAQPGWDQINLGTLYSLSKRTSIYLIAVAQQGRNADAQIYRAGLSTSRRQVAVTTGIRHLF